MARKEYIAEKEAVGCVHEVEELFQAQRRKAVMRRKLKQTVGNLPHVVAVVAAVKGDDFSSHGIDKVGEGFHGWR
eukprot:m.21526 g.21526  ORF g.21526 m.21526 type:complete len:75 (-) comp9019_c0_seq2:297-521(-)